MAVIRRDDGTQLKVLGDDVTIKLPSAASPFGMSIVTVDLLPGAALPPVTHAREEEVYFVLAGELTMSLAGEEQVLRSGDLAHVPPRTPHGYRNASGRPVRFLSWTVGGPVDRFFVEMNEQVRSLPEDGAKMKALMARYGVALAAPPPGAAEK